MHLPDIRQGLVQVPHLTGVEDASLLSPCGGAAAYRYYEVAETVIRHRPVHDQEQSLGGDRALQVELYWSCNGFEHSRTS